MTFEKLLIFAKLGDENARARLLDMYSPMLLKSSRLNGCLDEDLYQELCLTMLKCIEQFII